MVFCLPCNLMALAPVRALGPNSLFGAAEGASDEPTLRSSAEKES